MSKAKTKKARRELKRDGIRKIAAHQRRTAKTATTPAHAPKPHAKKHQKTTPAPAPAPIQAPQNHAAPFGPYEHILLVGEGDFSFAHSLAVHHGCANLTATSHDTRAAAHDKYPTFAATHAALTSLTPPVPLHHAIDATKLSTYKHLRCARDDAHTGWDTVVFQFPHTGGLSTHVNRQVRANQALLVAFFTSCLEAGARHGPFLRMGGRIVVTLFEGEPYSLWNVRDLARHVGLRVVESWRFDFAAFEGYRHVRTLGAIDGGGGWKGEDREARTYVFEKVPLVPDSEEEAELGVKKGKSKARARERVKRKRRGSESEDD
ncbi:hypothetical protein BDU57DRAFT_557698 [Ampelomyces quisqualis]|uniref:25S rRNA (uridine-N(3))-methyltransferase BMT5-like domain-containing protein n=1 Tax=Ampelomyces quisqualis TaxID=50730 RepID=A0A6A5QIM8_AMPQU|nr:hypothetical protein BDU57DRAFT_557698 [Ampelomyces quisqualis]